MKTNLDITYSSNKLEKQCTRSAVMQRSFKQSICKKLQLRLTELASADILDDLLSGPGNWHPLSADRDGQYGGNLSRHDRIVVSVDTSTNPADALVIEIIDYHD